VQVRDVTRDVTQHVRDVTRYPVRHTATSVHGLFVQWWYEKSKVSTNSPAYE